MAAENHRSPDDTFANSERDVSSKTRARYRIDRSESTRVSPTGNVDSLFVYCPQDDNDDICATSYAGGRHCR